MEGEHPGPEPHARRLRRLPGGQKQLGRHTFRSTPLVDVRLDYCVRSLGVSKSEALQRAICTLAALLEAQRCGETAEQAMARAYFDVQQVLREGLTHPSRTGAS